MFKIAKLLACVNKPDLALPLAMDAKDMLLVTNGKDDLLLADINAMIWDLQAR